MADHYILVVDQGTSSSRALLFDQSWQVVAQSQHEIALQTYPDGRVEQCPNELIASVRQCMNEVLAQAEAPDMVQAMGIANQRETFVVWDTDSGEPLHPAIVWQDSRTAAACADIRRDEATHEELKRRSGLVADPYFSATKLSALLDSIPDARERAALGQIRFGTVDTWLLWNLTRERTFATDSTNASRTLLFNLETRNWDPWLCDLFQIPVEMLPRVQYGMSMFGTVEVAGVPIPVMGVLGDQQASLLGSMGNQSGSAITYGTGAFLLSNTGDNLVHSHHGLLTTLAVGKSDRCAYALEGSTFSAGSAVRWLRDGAGVIRDYSEIEPMLDAHEPADVYMVPAFTGLGAPWWDADARAALYGMTLNSTPRDLVYATLEAICFQTRDLLRVNALDGVELKSALRASGGMAINPGFLQLLSNCLQMRVERPATLETTALGAAFICGISLGWVDGADLSRLLECDLWVEPNLSANLAEERYGKWVDAVRRTLTTPQPQS